MKFDAIKISMIISVVVLSFFLIHSVFDLYFTRSQISLAKEKVDSIKANKYLLFKNIEKFGGSEIDQDLLETQARNILALVPSEEKIIFWKDNPGKDLDVYFNRA